MNYKVWKLKTGESIPTWESLGESQLDLNKEEFNGFMIVANELSMLVMNHKYPRRKFYMSSFQENLSKRIIFLTSGDSSHASLYPTEFQYLHEGKSDKYQMNFLEKTVTFKNVDFIRGMKTYYLITGINEYYGTITEKFTRRKVRITFNDLTNPGMGNWCNFEEAFDGILLHMPYADTPRWAWLCHTRSGQRILPRNEFYVLKVSLDPIENPDVKDVKNEADIYDRVLRKILQQNRSPHFVRYYNWFTCSSMIHILINSITDDSESADWDEKNQATTKYKFDSSHVFQHSMFTNEIVENWEKNYNLHKSHGLIIEYIDGTNFYSQASREEFTDVDARNAIFQIGFGLRELYLSGILHGDIHGMNILIEKLPKSTDYIYFLDDDHYVILKQTFVMKIFDFDRSTFLPIIHSSYLERKDFDHFISHSTYTNNPVVMEIFNLYTKGRQDKGMKGFDEAWKVNSPDTMTFTELVFSGVFGIDILSLLKDGYDRRNLPYQGMLNRRDLPLEFFKNHVYFSAACTKEPWEFSNFLFSRYG